MDLSYSSDGFASYYERWKLRNKDVIIIRWEEEEDGGRDKHINNNYWYVHNIIICYYGFFFMQVDALKVNRNKKRFTK